MSAISGTRRAMKEMSDGTIRVSIDIDPIHRAAFFSMFGSIDMPVALAPLIADFEQGGPDTPIKSVKNDGTALDMGRAGVGQLKGGQLARLAGRWCNDALFYAFIVPIYDRYMGGSGNGTGDLDIDEEEMTLADVCRHAILVMCNIESRAELDHDPVAADKFHKLIREPYAAWLKER